jgi:hypothetical protein
MDGVKTSGSARRNTHKHTEKTLSLGIFTHVVQLAAHLTGFLRASSVRLSSSAAPGVNRTQRCCHGAVQSHGDSSKYLKKVMETAAAPQCCSTWSCSTNKRAASEHHLSRNKAKGAIPDLHLFAIECETHKSNSCCW